MPQREGDNADRSSQPPDPLEDLKRLTRPVLDFHADHPVYFWLILTGVTTGVLVAGSWLWPELFVDSFLWPNFWGPTETDARQVHQLTRNGVTATTNYTLLSEIVYGVILAGALVSIYQHLFKKRGIAVDGKFIAALLPYVFFGPLARAMEDASVFCEAATPVLTSCDPGVFSWAFISPFIYVVTAAAVIVHLLMASRSRDMDRERQTSLVAAWLGVQVAVYAFVFYAMRDQFVAMVEPWALLGVAVVALGVYHVARRRGGSHLHWSMASWGLPMVSVPVVLTGHWIQTGHEAVTGGVYRVGWLFFEASPNALANQAWPFVPAQAQRVLEKAAPDIVPMTLLLTAATLLAVGLVGWALRDRFQEASFFLDPLNLGLVAGHMVDGFGTFLAICSSPVGGLCSGSSVFGIQTGGYGEKHPISEIFLGFLDGWAFPLMKLALVVLIILLVDRARYVEDEDPDLIGLVKLAVLILGLAPGSRSIARVALGL